MLNDAMELPCQAYGLSTVGADDLGSNRPSCTLPRLMTSRGVGRPCASVGAFSSRSAVRRSQRQRLVLALYLLLRPAEVALGLTGMAAVLICSGNRSVLSDYYEFVMPEHDTLEKLTTKEGLQMLARQYAIPAPQRPFEKTCLVE
jgi:hypothetical protein